MNGSEPRGVPAETLRSISTPDRVESRLGTLAFRDGAPSAATAELLYDHLDFVHGVEGFINAFPGASLAAMHQGFLDIGAEDNSVLLFSDLMDSASLFLTANCDTVYFLSFLNLSDGPIVLDIPALGSPSGILGTIDDMWFRWVTDFGVPPQRSWGRCSRCRRPASPKVPASRSTRCRLTTSATGRRSTVWCSRSRPGPLFTGGYELLDPPPQITADGAVPTGPSDGARKLNARTAFYPYTGITPAMCMRVAGLGSQYLVAMRDSTGEYLDGARGYWLTLPPGSPEDRFWSLMPYDNQTRSMLQTDRPMPGIGSQSGTVQASPDGSTRVYFGPTAPEGRAGNWVQTLPGKGFFIILRLYNPLPSFFDKSWRPGEMEPA